MALITNLEDYQDAHFATLSEVLLHRIQIQPINLFFFILFLLAIIHVFIAHNVLLKASKSSFKQGGFWQDFWHFMGETEVVFGVWCIPLFLGITWGYGWGAVLDYIHSIDYSEALLIFVVMAMASTYPILNCAERFFRQVASWGGKTPLAWWLTLLGVAPFLGSLLKETIAMTIIASLLARHFYVLKPSRAFAYVTLALLFLHTSIGGLLSSFGSSAVMVVKKPWGWDSWQLLSLFAVPVILVIGVNLFLYAYLFRKELQTLKTESREEEPLPSIPFWVTFVHILVLAWLLWNDSEPVIALGSFVLFLGFFQATASYQKPLDVKSPLLVGFFIASLLILGGLQGWWIEPIVLHLSKPFLMLGAVMISAVSHNTYDAYIFTKIRELSESVKYLLLSGVMIGAGLTLISNGPNLIGYSLLSSHFDNNLSPMRLLKTALLPTGIAFAIFWLYHFCLFH